MRITTQLPSLLPCYPDTLHSAILYVSLHPRYTE
jgi:hypothetical protein